MKEELISFETAKLAKEKGFNIPVPKYYLSNGSLKVSFEDSYGNEREYKFDADDLNHDWNVKGWIIHKDGGMCFGCKSDNKNYFISYSAPSQSLLQKWLREVHNCYIKIVPEAYTTGINFNWQVLFYDPLDVTCWDIKSTGLYGDNGEFPTYELALEAALLKSLTLI